MLPRIVARVLNDFGDQGILPRHIKVRKEQAPDTGNNGDRKSADLQITIELSPDGSIEDVLRPFGVRIQEEITGQFLDDYDNQPGGGNERRPTVDLLGAAQAEALGELDEGLDVVAVGVAGRRRQRRERLAERVDGPGHRSTVPKA